MAILLDESGQAILDEAFAAIYDESGVGTLLTLTPTRQLRTGPARPPRST